MKVVVNKSEIIKEKPCPKLVINSIGYIVLALSVSDGRFTGIVVSYDGNPTYKICDSIYYFPEKEFKDFDGSITLSND